jgi:hypothetical protein
VPALLESRQYLLDALEELPVPPSPLDALIGALLGDLLTYYGCSSTTIASRTHNCLLNVRPHADALGGPSQVAEMTGRKGRMVREGEQYVYQLRDAHKGGGGSAASASVREEAIDSVNIQERAAFMTGKKLVAIISDAGPCCVCFFLVCVIR